MRRLVTKCKEIWKHLLKQKGQGLTEFVLVLAFCAILGWIASEVGFMDAIGAVFDSGKRPETVTAAIGGGGNTNTPSNPTDPTDTTDPSTPPTPSVGPGVGPSGFDWGKINPNEYYLKAYKNDNVSLDGGKTTVDFDTAAAQADRLAADQKALENIGRYFIGKTKEFVTGLMKDSSYTADMGKDQEGQELHLGHFVQANENDPTSMVFVADRDMKGSGETTVIVKKDGKKETKNVNNDIFKWMKNPEDPDSVRYDNDYNYLVSDYVVSQSWADVGGTDQGNGLRLKLEYDYTGKDKDDLTVQVIGAQVVIDAKSQNNAALRGNEAIKDQNGKLKYNLRGSEGLDVQVRLNADGEVYVTHNNTAKEVTLDNYNTSAINNNVLYNWYGEGDYRMVQAYIDSKAITLDGTGITREFKQGDIIKTGSNSWYVYKSKSDKTLTVSSTKITSDFVKIETNTARYWHENDRTPDGINIKTLKSLGTLFTKDNGDVFVCVKKQNGNIPINIVTDINESNSDWLKIGNLRQGEGEGQGQGQGGTQTGGNGEIQSAPYQNIQVSYYDITVDNWDTIKTENKIKKGTIFKYNNKYYISLANDVSSLNFDNSDNGLFKNYNSTELKNVYYDKDYAGQSYPVLKSGDIVVVEGNGTYAFLNSGTDGSWYSYPINVNDGNLVKLFD